MCDFQIDYRFLNSKSSTIKTKKMMKMKCSINIKILISGILQCAANSTIQINAQYMYRI